MGRYNFVYSNYGGQKYQVEVTSIAAADFDREPYTCDHHIHNIEMQL